MKLNNLIKTSTLLAAAGMLMASSAQATLVINVNPGAPGTPATSVGVTYLGNIGNGNITTAELDPLFGSSVGTMLYKINSQLKNGLPDEDGSPLAASYETSPVPWNSSSLFPLVISYVGGQIAKPATVLVVKDGNQGTKVYNISGWNGTDSIEVYNVFWPDKVDPSGTSHLEFYGTAGFNDTPRVPEPSTVLAGMLLLLPFGASAVRILRKNRNA